MTYLMFLAGLIALMAGGEFLIRGAVGIAERLHIPAFVIGMTVIGFGTSMPELMVSLEAALLGSPGIAIGNIIGSNIANILLILGVSAMITPIALGFNALRRDLAVMAAATLILGATLWDGSVSALEGGVFVLLMFGFLGLCFVKNGHAAPEIPPHLPAPLWRNIAFALGGLLVLMFGARLLVTAAVTLARDFGISEAVIGLTIVAIGTSLPELAASLVAAFRGHAALAVGNVVGSNIFNILGILGVTALIAPLPAETRFLTLDWPVALAAAMLLIGILWRANGVPRAAGGVFLALYAGYITFSAL